MITRELQIFLAALMFFTRIPGVTWIEQPEEHFKQAPRYFPLIGWIIGAIGAGVIWGGSLIFPLPLAVLLSMTATIILTGAIHEDGFADVCDGFGGGWTKAQILEIMKDSRVGLFGVIGIVLLVGMKFLCLISLPREVLLMAVVSGHSLSRFVSISFMYTHEYAREDATSKAKPVVKQMTVKELLFAGVIGIIPLIAFVLIYSQLKAYIIGGIVVWIVRWMSGRYFTRWIGGYTGDCLGAVQQLTEVMFYLVLVAMA